VRIGFHSFLLFGGGDASKSRGFADHSAKQNFMKLINSIFCICMDNIVPLICYY
jgi:hypothetical protein